MMMTIEVLLVGAVFALLLYGTYRLASWESRLITDWLDGDRTTPPPNSAFFPENIARQWWEDYRRRSRD